MSETYKNIESLNSYEGLLGFFITLVALVIGYFIVRYLVEPQVRRGGRLFGAGFASQKNLAGHRAFVFCPVCSFDLTEKINQIAGRQKMAELTGGPISRRKLRQITIGCDSCRSKLDLELSSLEDSKITQRAA